MSKTTKGLLIAAFCILATCMVLSTLYTYSISEELSLLRREGRSDVVYLRSRIRDLESELADHQAVTSPPTEIEDPTSGMTGGGAGEDSETTPAVENDESTEDVTIPTHSSHETSPSDETEASLGIIPVSPYLVAAHEGMIGVFDATGVLLKTANVYIMTLPESDRSALEVGVPADSWAEALRLLDMYE